MVAHAGMVSEFETVHGNTLLAIYRCLNFFKQGYDHISALMLCTATY